jgi:N-acetylated-alpha-linked acidic dipeptidase
LEAARALGYLYRSGWRPQFSIAIVGFDGEEIGEVGSETYVRMHEGALRSGCIAYINEDENATGQFFGATAAAPLEHLLAPATQLIRDPQEERRTLFQRWRGQNGGTRVEGPGGGSDFEAFLYDAGIPTIEVGFEGIFGVYHSGFDDLTYATTQADPGFVNHRALAQLVALMAMRLSSGTVPYQLSAYVPRMRAALGEIASGHGKDLDPLSKAIDRFASQATSADRRGIDGNREIAITQRLNRLFYGRNGYSAVAFPDVSQALASQADAAISAAVGRTVHDLDDISREIANARRP